MPPPSSTLHASEPRTQALVLSLCHLHLFLGSLHHVSNHRLQLQTPHLCPLLNPSLSSRLMNPTANRPLCSRSQSQTPARLPIPHLHWSSPSEKGRGGSSQNQGILLASFLPSSSPPSSDSITALKSAASLCHHGYHSGPSLHDFHLTLFPLLAPPAAAGEIF